MIESGISKYTHLPTHFVKCPCRHRINPKYTGLVLVAFQASTEGRAEGRTPPLIRREAGNSLGQHLKTLTQGASPVFPALPLPPALLLYNIPSIQH